ncbi:MAG TPA: hypothetical protein VHA82_19605 [Ramlibacter sp.]|uniref:hypothetical protein n=1 Tax=Ramlibacter sp. TaxID=1917967 RepID=UPI002D025716|nr:hypothetical protein [Ramlibacter sp.]HVZ46024.1 hypothetical protein [Ramlibacter sp.]
MAGATLLIADGPNGEKHPTFILNDPFSVEGYGSQVCVLVNASTPRLIYDKTCMLPAGCHPSIKHESFVFFAKARVRQAGELERLVAARTYDPGQPADIRLVKKIVAHMHDAIELDDEIREIARRIEAQLEGKR